MNVFDLFAKISLDTSEYDNGLNEASSKSSSFASKIGGGLATAAKAGAAAIAATSTAVAALAKQSVSAYADFEQLEGGIETLFGDSAQKVLADANNAFKTAGMSANEYMETSIQSAAALINSLEGDQAKAAELMNVSITDMADNVNKMGTSMEAVQNAYRGFSRGNFTMLDNLALGFSGSKEGMQELLDKAHEFSGIEYNIDSYADIVQAIHVVQGEMGISGRTAEEAAEIIERTGRSSEEVFEQLGTTAKESSGTISGSLSALKSAWTNLIGGLANDNADIDQLISNVVDNAETVFNNVLPIAEKALNGIVSFVEKIVPVISDKLPGIIDTLLPVVINAGISLFNGIVSALPSIIQILLEQLPLIMSTIVNTLMELAPMLIDVAFEVIMTLSDALIDALPELIPAITDIILTIVEKLTNPDTLTKLVGAAIQIIIALTQGIINALPMLIARVPDIVINLVQALVDCSSMLFDGAVELFSMILQAMIELNPKIQQIWKDIFDVIKAFFKDKFNEAKQWGKDLIANFVQGIKDMIGKVKDVLVEVGQTVVDFLGFSEPKKGPLSNFHTYSPDMIDLWNKGIEENEYKLEDQLAKSFDFSEDLVATVNPTAVVSAPATNGATNNIQGMENATFVIPVYVGGDKVDEHIINAVDAYNHRSGGR